MKFTACSALCALGVVSSVRGDAQTDALLYINETDANMDWLNYCYNYPFYLYIADWVTVHDQVEGDAFAYVRKIFSKSVGVYRMSGAESSANGCAGWTDVTNEPNPDLTFYGSATAFNLNKIGFVQSLGKAMAEGLVRADYLDDGSIRENATFLQLPEYTLTTTIDPLLNLGPVPMALVWADPDGTSPPHGTEFTDLESVDCVDIATANDYTSIFNHWNVPSVWDVAQVEPGFDHPSITHVYFNGFDDFDFMPAETKGYVYAYYMCSSFYSWYYPTTSTTPGFVTQAPKTTGVTAKDGGDAAVVVSATVGGLAGAGLLGLGYYLSQGQCTVEVDPELEGPEVFGSGTYDYEDEEPSRKPAKDSERQRVQVVTSELE